MKTYNVKLKDKKEICENTFGFYIEKPRDFNFIAGQYILITLPDLKNPDPRGNTRTFTIASSPHESDLMIATRISSFSSGFKISLKNLSRNSLIQISDAQGEFTDIDIKKPMVFLAGGIGITPFRSMIVHKNKIGFNNFIYLFYSNKRPEDSAFLDELNKIKNSNYKFIKTMTDMSSSKKPCNQETGFIDKNMLEKYTNNLTDKIYFIAGPPAFVNAMRNILLGTNIDQVDIKFEEFYGY
jgi:ferredoxin-NADP reductase